MASYDSNIKPVEGLQNIARLTPAGQREQRKRRRNLPEEDSRQSAQEPSGSIEEQDIEEQDLEDELAEDENDPNTIDYRA